jgi:hypothetical protein
VTAELFGYGLTVIVELQKTPTKELVCRSGKVGDKVMPIDKQAAVDEMTSVLAQYNEVERKYTKRSNDGTLYIDPPENEAAEIVSQLEDAIKRFSPPGRKYGEQALGTIPSGLGYQDKRIKILAGVLSALRKEYIAGRLQTIQELIHSDLFADFLEMADYLLTETYKDPAAVIAGGVLEEHLRKLCDKHGIPRSSNGKPHMIDRMNADLAKQNVYGKIDQQQVTTWAAIRNKAAHAEYATYDDKQVALMIQGMRGFISRFPA